MSKFSEQREGHQAQGGPRFLWIGLGIGIVVVAWAAYYFFYYSRPTSTLDDFAKCLTSKHAKMYGLAWCPHCADQKEMFGFAFQYVDYVECGIEQNHTETEQCKQAGIKNFPTWQFADGSRKEGTEPLAMLSEKTGCRLP